MSLTKVDKNSLTGELLQMHYVPVNQAVLWDRNPKLHDIGAIISAIQEYGFRDPPAWDATLQGLAEGNGRTKALQSMQHDNYSVPRGIAVNSDTGEWCMPILFGIDAESRQIAERYAIDHNNLTMTGGDFSMHDLAKMWDTDGYMDLLVDINISDSELVSMDAQDIELMLAFYNSEEEIEEDDEPELPLPNSDVEFSDEKGMTLSIYFENTSLYEDVYDSIQDLLNENPGWYATILGD